VAYRNGSPVRLGELGRVIDSIQNDKNASWFNAARAVQLAIQRQPGTNTVEVVDTVKRLLPTFREQMPPGHEARHLLRPFGFDSRVGE
jgi:HAE1 family hydrophobic/amphiphilic exporter-1